MNKQIAVRLLVAAGVLMLLASLLFGFMQQWIFAVLVGSGAAGCLAAAFLFKRAEM